ncbi:MAG: dihydroneopterin aldolase [Candidatus Aureabacteria bacterium]|nr:dihydroneopterin aldolase [Candidatus Auribacterota bacterium]
MNGIIGLKDYPISCIIGDLPEERLREQQLLIDVEVRFPFDKVIKTDTLEDTLDYMLVAKKLKFLARTRKYRLIELFAAEAISVLYKRWPLIKGVRIKIRKKACLPDGGEAYVMLSKGEI